MLAIATVGHVVLVDPSSLKRPPPSLPPTCSIPAPPIASAWSPDSTSFYVASAHTITRYDASGTLIKTVYERAEGPESAPIACVVAKDKGTLLFGMGASVHTLEHSASPSSASKIVHTLAPHPDPTASPLRALSLSNDGTLLAAASARAVLVHNLSLGAHTVLRNLPVPPDGDASAGVCACVFHPHSRVRLFLGIARNLVVYDITRPSGPSRVIPMSEAAEGRVVGIACSPYSKTLLAVACSEGYVAMVDLDKEKGRIRSFHYKVGLTSLAFSTDGATLYVGTTTGQLLVQTLRAVEPPKTVDLGPGARVECMAIAKKTKLSLESPTKAFSGPALKPLTPQDVNTPRRSLNGPLSPTFLKDASGKKSASPGDSATGDGTVRPKARTPPTGVTPVRKRVSSTTAIGSKKATTARSLFASAGGDHDSAKTDSEAPKDPDGTIVPALPTAKPRSRVTSLRSKPSTAQGANAPAPRTSPSAPRTRTVSQTARNAAAAKPPNDATSTPQTTPRARTVSTPKSPSALSSKSPVATRAPSPSAASARGHIRTRTVSTASRTTSGASALSVSRATSRTSVTTASSGKFTASGMSSTTGSGTARERSPVPPVPRLPRTQAGERLRSSERARTPSPVLRMRSPVMDEPPPFPVKGAGRGLSVLGLGTPEVERWIEAGHWKGKGETEKRGEREEEEIGSRRVGFARRGEEDEGVVFSEARREGADEETGDEALRPKTRERPLSMQVTPRRPTGSAWAPSPLRNSVAGGSPGPGGVQTMLHALIKDAMLDFQQETKAEMIGLHLDLVRMGRSWRQEMRGAMEEYVGDLRELRDENRKLREENERLRRGY